MEMKNRFQEAIQNVQRQRHLARRSVAMVLVLAMLTAMSVSWRLHQDGIALAADDTRYYCGKEEHKHTDDCYIEGTEPICGYEEGEIVEETMDSADDAGDGDSSAADWDEAGSEPESEPATQEEPEPEVVLHHHTADCYEEKEVLTCGIESDHVHQDYCYDQETGELLCTEHEHTDDCYTLEEVLVCGQEEGEPEKTDDGAALYDRDENSAEESDFAEEPETAADPEPEKEATKPETDDEIDTGYTVHHHTAECYGKVLICGKEEHEHTAACLVNPNAEIDAEYDAKTPDRTSVDWAQDMVLVAQSQLGYTESKADVDEDGNGYTMYADQYYKDKPMVYADWDSTFVAYCLYHAGVPQDIIPQYASISALRGELARMNSEYYTDDPQDFASILPGDIVMYKNAEGRETIGVVSDAAVDEETDLTTALTVISGDVATGYESDGETTIDQVAEVSVALSEVTSVVSVNAAYGYDVDDMVEDPDAAVDPETMVDLGQYITKIGASQTEFVTDSKESYRSNIQIDFEIKQPEKNNIIGNQYAYKIDLPQNLGLDPRYMEILLSGEHSIDGGHGNYKFVKNADGTYSILLKFNQTYLDKTSEINTHINFWGEIGTSYGKEDGSIEIPFYNNKTLTIPTGEIKYPDGSTNSYDLSVKKQAKYDTASGKLTYTVNVTSKKGTPDYVNFADEITNLAQVGNLTLGTPTITVEKRKVTEARNSVNDAWQQSGNPTEWETDTAANLTYTSAGKISGTLPQMKAALSEDKLQRTYEEYRVTYVYDVSSTQNVDTSLKNEAKVDSSKENITIKGSDTKSVDIKKAYTLKKTAGSYTNGKIQWTITFNENHQDITGAVLTDNMTIGNTSIGNVFANAENIQITPATGWEYTYDKNNGITGIKFTGTDNTNEYKITYYTEHEQGDSDYKVKNAASATFPSGGTVDSGIKETTVPKRGIAKYAVESSVSEDGNTLTIPWKVSIDFTNGEKLKKDTIFKDDFTKKDAHWMTRAQAKALIDSLKWSDTPYTNANPDTGSADTPVASGYFNVLFYTEKPINWNVGTEYNALTDTDKIYGFKIVVVQEFNLPSDKAVLKLNYSTTADLSAAGATAEYRNVFDYQGYSYKYNKSTITKMDGNGGTGTTTVTSDDDTITWKIKIHTAKVGLHQSVTVQDQLPKGVQIQSVQVQSYTDAVTVTPEVDFSTKKNNEILSGKYDSATGILTMTLSNENFLKLDSDYTFIVTCKAVSDPTDGTTAIIPGKAYEYKNEASAWYDDNNTVKIGESSQTQEWTQKENTVEVKPLGKNVAMSGSGPNKKLDYSVEINPDGVDLLQNAASLTVTDTLSVKTHPDTITLSDGSAGDTSLVTIKASLDEASVKLFYAQKDTNGKLQSTGVEVPGYRTVLDSYQDPKNAERRLYIIKLMDVPDDQPMVLQYTYHLTSNIEAVYPQKWKSYGYWEQNYLKNTAELEGTGYQSVTENTKTDFTYAGTSASVDITHSLTIKKVENNQYNKLLAGAVFKLQKYENAAYADVEGKTYTTDENGQITVRQGKTDTAFKFDTNTLYRLVECTPPTGYALPEDPEAAAIYFYFSSTENVAHTLPEIPEKQQAVDLSQESRQVYVENESNNTSVTVEKKWQNADGTKDETPPSSIQFNLIKLASTTKPISGKKAMVSGSIVSGYAGSTNVVYSFDNTVQYAEGTVLTFKIKYPRANDTRYNPGLVPNIYWNGSAITPTVEKPEGDSGPITWVYTCTLGESTNKISGNIESFNSHTFTADFVQPTAPTDMKVVDSTTYTLSAADNWRKTISGLPRTGTDTNGQKVYYSYKVEEVSTAAGYTVSYNTTNGITSGLITMVNTKEQDAPTYELPSTGSPGGTVPYTAGGAAIALAAVLCGYNSRRKRKRGEE